MNSHVMQRLEIVEKTSENLSELDEFIKETRASFSSLDSRLLECEIELALQRASLLADNRERDEADRLLANLAKRSENSGEVLFAIARFYSRRGYNWTHTIDYMYRAAQTNPASFATNPDVLSEFEWFLQKVAPDDGYTEVRDFIGQHCFDHFADMMNEALYQQGEDFHTLRRNARYLLEKRGTSIDLTTFYLVDILTSPGSRDSKALAETLDYFARNAQNQSVIDEIARQIASYPGEFKLFENYHYSRGEPETLLISGPFYTHFKEYLRNRLISDRANQRLNAFNVLMIRQEISEKEHWQYHIRNLIDFKSLQWSRAYAPALYESVDYLMKNPLPPDGSDKPENIATGRIAARAARELFQQIKKAVDNSQDCPYTDQGNYKAADFEQLATKLQQTFPTN